MHVWDDWEVNKENEDDLWDKKEKDKIVTTMKSRIFFMTKQ